MLHLPAGSSPANSTRSRVDAFVGREREMAALVPELIRQVPHGGQATGTEHSDLQRTQFRLFDAVVRLLRALASREPMVLIIDDLHDADTASLQMLRLLARSLKDVPVLVIGTHREAEVERSPELQSAIAALAAIAFQSPSGQVPHHVSPPSSDFISSRCGRFENW